MTYSTEIAGLPGGPLITTYPIHLRILPSSMTRNRPGIKARKPRRSVQHGNGNPNSSAAGEASYLNNGAEGRQASYHAASDDKEVWVMIPADEVTWQSADGDGPGNMNGFSDEMVEDAALWANPARRDRCIAITADFMGRVSARINIAKPERHWDFNYNNAPSERHHCPDKLMSVYIGGRLAWDIYVEQWQAAKTDELKRMKGEPPAPIYATPATISWKPGDLGWRDLNGRPVYALTAEVQARRDNVVRRAWASSSAPKSGENLKNGQKVKAIGSFAIERKKANGKVENERWIVLEDLSRVRASALTPLLPIKP